MKIEKQIKCPDCNYGIAYSDTGPRACLCCNGTGKITVHFLKDGVYMAVTILFLLLTLALTAAINS